MSRPPRRWSRRRRPAAADVDGEDDGEDDGSASGSDGGSGNDDDDDASKIEGEDRHGVEKPVTAADMGEKSEENVSESSKWKRVV